MSSAREDDEPLADRFAALAERIATLNPTYRAFSHLAPIDPDELRRLQREQRDGRQRSGIHGMAVSVKGSIPVSGLPWTEGSAIFAGRIAREDARIVAQARAAGGIIVGATTLSELAMYGVENPFEPMGLNPWDVRRTAGGSSTGAGVAAALGLADVNIGTDSGGSIRNPACHCGVVGFMPRIGALSGEGKANHAPSLSTVGLITRSVAILLQAYAALGGGDGEGAPSRKLLTPSRLIATMCDEATLALFAQGLEHLRAAGVTLVECEIDGWMQAERAAGIMSLFECGQALSRLDLTRASDGIKQRAATAKRLTGEQFGEAKDAAMRFKRALRQALDETGADAVATPTWPFAAPLIHADTVTVQSRAVPIDPHRNCFVRAANAVDACAISLPLGIYPQEQVPAGLHLMAPGGRELRLLSIARLIENALPRLPDVPIPDRPL